MLGPHLGSSLTSLTTDYVLEEKSFILYKSSFSHQGHRDYEYYLTVIVKIK